MKKIKEKPEKLEIEGDNINELVIKFSVLTIMEIYLYRTHEKDKKSYAILLDRISNNFKNFLEEFYEPEDVIHIENQLRKEYGLPTIEEGLYHEN